MATDFLDPHALEPAVIQFARETRLQPELLLLLMDRLSRLRADAHNPCGGAGLLMLPVEQARRLGLRVDRATTAIDFRRDERLNPLYTLQAGKKYFKELIERYRFGNRLEIRDLLTEYLRQTACLKSADDHPTPEQLAGEILEEFLFIRGSNYHLENMMSAVVQNWRDYLKSRGLFKELAQSPVSDDPSRNLTSFLNALKQALPRIPDPVHRARLSHDIGVLYLHANQGDSAVAYLQRALRLERPRIDRHLHLAHMHVFRQQYEEAIRLYRIILMNQPERWDVHTELAEVLLITGDRQNARRHLLRALSQNPNATRAMNSLAILYFLEGKTDLAEQILEKAFELDSRQFLIRYHLGLIKKINLQQEMGFPLTELGIYRVELFDSLQVTYREEPETSPRPFDWPVKGIPRLTSFFGWRPNPFDHRNHRNYFKFHTGIDIDGYTGEPVYAPADGEIIWAGWRGGYGLSIRMEHHIHGDKYVTGYHHLSEVLVKAGQRVRRGEIIGRIGATGDATGDHLHFMVTRNGELVDPLEYLKVIPKYQCRM